MDEIPNASAPAQRKLWVRALLMLLFAAAFQVGTSVLLCVALVQLLLAAVADGPNDRLRVFGDSVGRYLAQVAAFEVFRSEEAPFPFADWPEAGR
jgi:hypothetical protein